MENSSDSTRAFRGALSTTSKRPNSDILRSSATFHLWGKPVIWKSHNEMSPLNPKA